MKISGDGLALIKRWEGCKLQSYRDSAGIWTVGYGITTNAGLGVIGPGMKITQAQADAWLLQALVKYEHTDSETIKRPMTQPQMDAFVSLCFNIGQAAFAKSSAARKFNEGDIAGAANAFLFWNKATVNGKKVVLEGLNNRRRDERKHFLKAAPPVAQKPVQPVPAPDDGDIRDDRAVEEAKAKKPLTIGQVMVYIVGAIIAAVAAYLGFGR